MTSIFRRLKMFDLSSEINYSKKLQYDHNKLMQRKIESLKDDIAYITKTSATIDNMLNIREHADESKIKSFISEFDKILDDIRDDIIKTQKIEDFSREARKKQLQLFEELTDTNIDNGSYSAEKKELLALLKMDTSNEEIEKLTIVLTVLIVECRLKYLDSNIAQLNPSKPR